MADWYDFNSPFRFEDDDGVTWPSKHAWAAARCGICGCADWEITTDLFALLDLFLAAKDAATSLYYDGLFPAESRKYVELLLHVLDRAGFLEHGSAIRGSWLTDPGADVARQLRREG